MKKIVIVLLFIFNCLLGISQLKTEEVVYLKNGSIIRGTIIEFLPGQTVKIETNCRNIWVFNADDVLKIVKEEKIDDLGEERIADKKYKLLMDGGVLIGEGYTPVEIPVSFHFINTYSFRPWLQAGMGTGIEFYEQKVVPLFIDSRLLYQAKEVTPFLGVKLGYGLPLSEYNGWFNGATGYGKGGIMFEPGLGVLLAQSKSTSVFFSFSFRYQRLNYHKNADWNRDESEILVNYNRLAFRFGFCF